MYYYQIDIYQTEDTDMPETHNAVLKDFALKAAQQASANGAEVHVSYRGSMVAVYKNGKLVQES